MPKAKPFCGTLPAKRVLYQQCPQGRDADPAQAATHQSHVHETKHGRPVVCRGWFPRTSLTRRGIEYGKP